MGEWRGGEREREGEWRRERRRRRRKRRNNTVSDMGSGKGVYIDKESKSSHIRKLIIGV